MKLDIKQLKEPENTLIMLHLSSKREDLLHVEYWIPKLQQSNISFSVLVRDKISFIRIKNRYPNAQILFAKSPVNVESAVNAQPKLKIVLHTANIAKNLHLLRFNSLQHIYIGSKKYDWILNIDKTYRAYDEMWVSRSIDYTKVLNNTINLRHVKIKNLETVNFEENLRIAIS